MSLPFPGAERAKHMGELRRGEQRWDVYLETQADAGALGAAGGGVRGRLHFVSQGRHKVTTWIFLELDEREIHDRFGEFSAVELWHFLQSLEDG
jgi:hypothetical protein